MFINAILFGVEENVRKYLHLNDSKLSNAKKNSLEFYKLYAISGAIAGFTQAFLLSPVELIKIKMQLPSYSNQYKNTWLCARSILEKGGIKGLMRGTNLTLLRDVPAITLYFVCFEYICNFHTKQKEDLSVSHLLLAGGLSGCLSWLLTYPIDVIKTRYQAESTYSSIKDCFRKTVNSEGYMGLWRGLNPTLFR
jgi:solute carrier family 25 carnitine/acylcarnitine transporter 20/29